MKLPPELAKRAKALRMQQLQLNYINLDMDRIALVANGDTEGAEAILLRMEQVNKAYEAVEAQDYGGEPNA